jgi:hypothetical protein
MNKNNMKKELIGSEFGDLFTIEEFKKLCEDDCFIDCDGIGQWSDGVFIYGNIFDNPVLPSDIVKGKINKEFTHIVWYNR